MKPPTLTAVEMWAVEAHLRVGAEQALARVRVAGAAPG